MKFLSQVIAAGSGSVGGCVYSRNRYGQYIRNRSVPVNTNTSQQQAVRNGFGAAASEWTSLLDSSERAAWDIYAANVPVTDALGQQQFLTGLNWYAASSTIRKQAGELSFTTAPIVFSLATLTITSATVSESTQLISTVFPAGQEWAGAADGGLMVYASRPFSPSRNYFAGPYRLAEYIQGNASPPTSPQTSPVPFPVFQGQRIGLQYRAFTSDNRISNIQRFVVDVGA